MQTSISNKFNYDLNNYLLNIDLINKYLLINSQTIPKLSKLTIELFSNEMLASLNNPNKLESDPEIQLKTFLILYVIDFYFPFINYINIKLPNKNTLQKCYVKKTFSNRQSINEIFVTLSNEFNFKHKHLLKKKSYQFDNSKIKMKQKKITFRTNVEFNQFLELEKLVNSSNPLKKISVFINFEFIIGNTIKSLDIKNNSTLVNLIQNLLFKFF